MNISTIKKTSLLAVVIGTVLALSVTGCSDDKKSAPVTQAAKSNHNPDPFDHSHDVAVTDVQKHKFEHEFADQCIARELKNSDNKDSDREHFSKPCTCIATFLMKDLTAKEAEKFLAEHQNPQSLRIKYENAAYHCLQEKIPPHEPNFSRPQ
ncbi:MAG: hypothetical protein Q8L68_04915 [Methylococcales bacterium]|nr:hypothetical protein [Methylococcales bacterium]